MGIEPALYQLMGIRMNSVMNGITNGDGEYQAIIRKSDEYSNKLDKMDLSNCIQSHSAQNMRQDIFKPAEYPKQGKCLQHQQYDKQPQTAEQRMNQPFLSLFNSLIPVFSLSSFYIFQIPLSLFLCGFFYSFSYDRTNTLSSRGKFHCQ